MASKKRFIISLISLSLFGFSCFGNCNFDQNIFIKMERSKAGKDNQEKHNNNKESEDEKPWFTGSLLSLSTTPATVGEVIITPVIWNYLRYGRYNHKSELEKISKTYSLNPAMRFYTGFATDWDIGFAVQMFQNYHKNKIYTGFGDSSIQIKHIVVHETDNLPTVTIGMGEILPTGSYHHLDPEFENADGTGAGAYITVFGIRLGKVFILNKQNSIRLRYDARFEIPTSVSISGQSVYNTGFGANGTAYPGNTFLTDCSVEYHIEKNWVLACDFYYSHSNKTPFKGNPGINKEGIISTAGRPSNDQFSLAPAIEYNYSENMGIIAGVWFTVWGRNTSAFYSPAISFYVSY